MTVDATDRALLNKLRENARTSYVDLAKEVGVSERTVRTRMRKLEEDTIQRYTVIERGVGLSALVRCKLGPGTEVGTLAGEFSTWGGVLTCYEVGGGLDADLEGCRGAVDRSAKRMGHTLFGNADQPG